jgi:HEAT repeats
MSDPGSLPLAAHPSVLVGLAVERWGERGFITRCVALYRTLSWGDEPELMSYVGGRRGPRFVEFGLGKEAYWLRVWALRAMLYAWHPSGVPIVVAGLADEHWRVREMAGKVVALRDLGAAAEACAGLLSDPTPRVRAVAARAIAVIGEAEHAPPLRELLDDPEPSVRQQAERALERLAKRLDRQV